MKFSILHAALIALAIAVLLVISGAFIIVNEKEQVVITQFGKPVGTPINKAGVYFKTPFIQNVTRIEKRVLEWDGPVAEMPTKDKLYIVIDTFARWKISDPLRYFIRLRDERSAQSRLDDILGSETRNTVARHELVELVRTSKDRKAAIDDTLVVGSGSVATGLPPIQYGRVALEKEIADQAREKLAEFGIELLDLRFKRVNYNPAVSAKIFDRMISERLQIAKRFRSEGEGEAAKINGSKERDLKQIDSEAFRKVQTIQGKADAEATGIYAAAYNQSPQAREFYEFTRVLETYRTSFGRDTTLVLSTQGSFLRFLKGATPADAPSPQSATTPTPKPSVPPLPPPVVTPPPQPAATPPPRGAATLPPAP